MSQATKRVSDAEKQLRLVKDEYAFAAQRNNTARVHLEKSVRECESKLLENAPDYAFSCRVSLQKEFQDGLTVSSDKLNLMTQFVDEINAWARDAISFDVMRNRFNKIVSALSAAT